MIIKYIAFGVYYFICVLYILCAIGVVINISIMFYKLFKK